jgi:hypothetical protein
MPLSSLVREDMAIRLERSVLMTAGSEGYSSSGICLVVATIRDRILILFCLSMLGSVEPSIY